MQPQTLYREARQFGSEILQLLRAIVPSRHSPSSGEHRPLACSSRQLAANIKQ